MEGILESFPEDLIGMWVIDGVSYDATVDTRFMQRHGPFAVGACVEIEFDPSTLIATKIKTQQCDDDDDDDRPKLEKVHGALESLPEETVGTWTVSGVAYTVDGDTQFDDDDTFAAGDCVKVKYIPSTLVAVEIELTGGYHCGTHNGGGHHGDDRKRYGAIDSFPAELTGEWVIDGIVYTAGEGTEFDQEAGEFAVGVCVEVKYLADSFVALEIETEDDQRCGGHGQQPGSFAKATGTLDVLPETVTGTWTIDGADYTVDETTILKEADGEFVVGVCVEVKFQTTNNLALEIETEDAYECDESTVPSVDDEPSLNVNFATGASGSQFVVTGSDFAADAEAYIKVNGFVIATLLTDSDGWLTFALESGDVNGRATTTDVEIEVAGELSETQTVTTDATSIQRNLPAGYSAPVLDGSGVPLAVGLHEMSASTQSIILLLMTLSLIGGTIAAKRCVQP